MTFDELAGELAERCKRIVLLAAAALSFGVSSLPESCLPGHAFMASGGAAWCYSASASTSDYGAVDHASLTRAREELLLASKILSGADGIDIAMEEYVASVRGIMDWLDRPEANLERDAAALAANLAASRLRFVEQTRSFRQWLALSGSDSVEVVIPERFVVEGALEEMEVPDYEARRLARDLLV